MGAQNSFKNQTIAGVNTTNNQNMDLSGNTSATAPIVAQGQGIIGAGQQQVQAGLAGAQGFSQGQGALAGNLVQQAAGNGPSAAQGQLTQATAGNNAQAAAAAASQKGINPALAARMALDSGAANNQQAAGQSALTKVQEQNNATSQLGNVLAAGQQGQINAAQIGNATTGQGNSVLGTGLGAQGAQNQLAVQQNLGTEGLNETGNLANQSQASHAQDQNFQESRDNTASTNSLFGGLANAAGGVASMFAKGGEVPMPMKSMAEQIAHHMTRMGHEQHFAGGGQVSPDLGVDLTDTRDVHPLDHVIQGGKVDVQKDPGPGMRGDIKVRGGKDMTVAQHLSAGGFAAPEMLPIPTLGMQAEPMAAPGEGSMDMSQPAPAAAPSALGITPLTAPAMKAGGKVDPAEDDGGTDNKASNDTVPTMLSPGEVVLPRSVSHDPERAAAFVHRILKNKRKGKPAHLASLMGKS